MSLEDFLKPIHLFKKEKGRESQVRLLERRAGPSVLAGLMVPDCAFQHLAEHVDTPQLASSFEATISKFDKNFSAHLLDLLARLSIYSTSDCEHGMASVISRWVWHLSRHVSLSPCACEAQAAPTP